MTWSLLGLKFAEFVITKGLDYLVEHPKFGIGNKLAKIILSAAVTSKHNLVEESMLNKAMEVL